MIYPIGRPPRISSKIKPFMDEPSTMREAFNMEMLTPCHGEALNIIGY